MKKLLTILGAVGLTATGASAAVSCADKPTTPSEKIVVTTKVQELLDSVIKGKKFTDEKSAIAAAKGIKLTTGLVYDGEPTNSGTKITIKVKADKGYKLADKSVVTFSSEWQKG